MSAPTLFVDINAESFRLARGAAALEFDLERTDDGSLAEVSRQRVIAALREHAGARAWCAVGARGLSLRRMTLPALPKDKLADLLRLQIESEFPVPPDELAWGWQALASSRGPAGPQQELLVAAVRRKTWDEYAGLFAAAGVPVSFIPAALARLESAPAPACALLEVGRRNSEWLSIENGAPSGVRALPWGAENLANARLPDAPGQKLYLTGKGAALPGVAARLEALAGGGAVFPPGPGADRGTLAGLERLTASGSGRRPLLLQTGENQTPNGFAARLPRDWIALAAALAVCLLGFPYLEALLFKPHLAKRLAEIHADEGRLVTIDRELDFFQYLRKNQPPFLDVFYLIAQSAPPGTTFDSFSLTRRGDLSLRGKMGGGTQVTELRTKLIDSGWFATLAVDEQTATPDRRVTVRITGQLKPSDARRALPAAPGDATPKPGKS